MVCYHFFRDVSNQRRSPARALCLILYQLFEAEKTSKLIRHAVRRYEIFDSKKGDFAEALDTLWEILQDIFRDKECGRIVLLFDAIDECMYDSQYNFISQLKRLDSVRRQHESSFQIIATSRPYWDIEKSFRELIDGIPIIEIRGEKSSGIFRTEVDTVIQSRVSKLPVAGGIKAKEKLIATLQAYDNRTYLWVHLILRPLETKPRVATRDLDVLLRNLPQSVNDAYCAILSKVDRVEAEQTKRLLQIVVAADRPVTLAEAEAALYARDHESHTSLNEERQSPEEFESWVRYLCGLFVSIMDSRLFLFHQTAKDYLTDTRNQDSPTCSRHGSHSFSFQLAHATMAEMCIPYLLLPGLRVINPHTMRISREHHEDKLKRFLCEIATLTEEYALLDYATKMWPFHLYKAGDIAKDTASESLREAAMAIYDLGNDQSMGIPSLSQTDWFLVWARLHDGMYKNPGLFVYPGTLWVDRLIWSSYFAHTGVVEILISKNANVHCKSNSGRTPLMWAARQMEAAVRLLVDNGADVNEATSDTVTALECASTRGDQLCVKLLLELGAHVQVGTSLFSAVHSRDCGAVKALLDAGVSVLPLHAGESIFVCLLLPNRAGFSNRIEILKLLLKRLDEEITANPEARFILDYHNIADGQPTALLAAIYLRDVEAVRILLSRGVDTELKWHVNVENPWTERWIAASLGYAHMYDGSDTYIDMLGKAGGQIDSQDERGETRLHVAARSISSELVQLLLDLGANPDIPDFAGNNALQTGVRNWSNYHSDVMKTLLSTTINVDHQNMAGRTALMYAAELAEEEPPWEEGPSAARPLLWLLESKAKTSVQSKMCRTALSYASAKGRTENASLLLKYGAGSSINLCDRRCRTPLFAAVGRGNPEMVQLLLFSGADPHWKDTHGRTALNIAYKLADQNKTLEVLSANRNKIVDILMNLSEDPATLLGFQPAYSEDNEVMKKTICCCEERAKMDKTLRETVVSLWLLLVAQCKKEGTGRLDLKPWAVLSLSRTEINLSKGTTTNLAPNTLRLLQLVPQDDGFGISDETWAEFGSAEAGKLQVLLEDIWMDLHDARPSMRWISADDLMSKLDRQWSYMEIWLVLIIFESLVCVYTVEV